MKQWLLILLFWTAAMSSRAQLCTGSLGDPIVHITFGAGGNPGPRLGSAALGYSYQSTDCPNDGSYTVRNNSAACWGSTWHNVSADHTGDAAGYFMMVNASNNPGDFYVDTVRGLCSGTTYEFAAWVLNISRTNGCNGAPIQPNITFRIERTDGTVLGTYNTGNIPPTAAPEWKQYGFFFTTTATVANVVVRMTNNAPGGCGNDLLLDDITFRPCGPLLTPGFTGAPGTQKTVCEGTAASFDLFVGVSAGYVSPRFQWQESRNGGPWSDLPGASTQSLTVSVPANEVPGAYRYRLTVAEAINWGSSACTIASAPLVILVAGRPSLGVTNNGPLCAGSAATLSATGAVSYSWSGAGGFSASGGIVSTELLPGAGTYSYTLRATDAAGCTWTDATTLIVHPKPVAGVAADTFNTCAGIPVTLQATGGGSYQWSPVAGLSDSASAAPVALPPDTIRYQVIVRNAEGCTDTAAVQLNVRPAPRADAGADRVIFLGDPLLLEGRVIAAPGYTVQWSPGYFLSNSTSLQAVAHPEIDTVYVLSVTSPDGCGTHRDSMRVRVYRHVVVPNVFTPNGDGINDRWEIPALGAYRSYTVEIFTRWDQPVMRCRNTFASWDGACNGKALPTGTYYYLIRIADTGQQIAGAVDLIR